MIPAGADILVLLVPLFSRLYEEMKAFYGLDMEVPTSEMALVRDLSKWLKACSRKQKLIIVLDALNQLDDGSKEDGQYQGSQVNDQSTEDFLFYANITPF